MNKDTTFGQKAVMIEKTKRHIRKNGWEHTGSSKAVTCSKCPECGLPTLINCVREGENFKDEAIGIFGVCFNRYSSGDGKCSGKVWVRKPLPGGKKHDKYVKKEVTNEQ